MRMFALPNEESYHVARWFLEHAGSDLDRLIVDAFDQAARCDKTELEMFDDYRIVSYELGQLLRNWFHGRFPWVLNSNPHDRRPRHGLLGPLLRLSCDRIDFDEVAAALLKLLGKWSPSDEDAYPFRPSTTDDTADDDAGDNTL